MSTVHGLPRFHENRCIGKALYCYKFENMKDNGSALTGINTIPYRPYELILDVDATEN